MPALTPSPAPAADSRHRRRRAVERPVEPAERDERRADRALRVDDDLAEVDATGRGRCGQSTTDTTTLAAVTSSRLQASGRSRSRVASYCSWCRRVRRATNRSMVQPHQAEQPQFLAGGRIDGEPVRVVGVALRAPHFVGVAIAPDRALAQQPVRREPRAGQHERRPPRRSRRARRRRRGRRSCRPARRR